MKCKWFACVYSGRDGCHIKGGCGEAERKTGLICPHYKDLCDYAKCTYCMRDSVSCEHKEAQ